MRLTSMQMFGLLVLAFAWPCERTGGGAGDKKSPDNESTKEIEKAVKKSVDIKQDKSSENGSVQLSTLLQQMASSNLAVREKASRAMQDTPGAIHYLRRNIPKDLEARRRAESIIKDLAPREFKRFLANLAKQNGEAPVDLVAELLIEYREAMDDEDWKLVLPIIAAISLKLTNQSDIKMPIPLAKSNIMKFPYSHADVMATRRVMARRIVAQELNLEKLPSLLQCLVVSRKIPEIDVCADSFVMMVGAPLQRPSDFKTKSLAGSLIYSDGDLYADVVSNSIVITRGRATIHQTLKCFVSESSRRSEKLSLFSLERVGMSTELRNGKIIVSKVFPSTAAHRAGVLSGDEILLGNKESLTDFECYTRRMFVKQGDANLTVARNDTIKKCVLVLTD